MSNTEQLRKLRNIIDACIESYIDTGDVSYMQKAKDLLIEVKQIKGSINDNS